MFVGGEWAGNRRWEKGTDPALGQSLGWARQRLFLVVHTMDHSYLEAGTGDGAETFTFTEAGRLF